MKQENAVPDRAATFVVHPTPGVGDATTVADAIAMLPAAGGSILVREGTYALSVTTTIGDIPVIIRGCGDSTIFDLGANAIAAFTISDTLTARHEYVFEDFKVTGTSVAGQEIVNIANSNFFAVTKIARVNSTGVQFPIEISGGGFSTVLEVQVDVQDCWFVPIAAGTGSLVNPSGFTEASVTFRNVNFMVDGTSTVGGAIGNDFFSPLDVQLYDCNISYTREDGLNTIHAERCRIFNYLGQGVAANAVTIFLGGLGADDTNIHPECAFIDCNIVGMSFDFTEAVNIVGGWIDSTTLSASVTNGKCQITGSTFRTNVVSTGAIAVFPHFGATPTSFINAGGELAIVSCRFTNPGNIVNRYIEAPDSFYIAYNAFANLSAGVNNAGIHVTGPNNIIVGNDFDALWAAPPIKEEGANVEGNVYDGNIGMNGNGGTDSVFVTPPSNVSPTTFNGSALFHRTNTTTDVFALVKMGLSGLATSDPGIRINPAGLVGGGTIKNIGANSMDIRETVTDAFGTTEAATATVTAGSNQVLKKMDEGPFSTTAFPPYTKYQIEVKSTTSGTPTTFNYQQNLNSEVTW